MQAYSSLSHLVKNYTALKKKKKEADSSPVGIDSQVITCVQHQDKYAAQTSSEFSVLMFTFALQGNYWRHNLPNNAPVTAKE